MRFPDHSYLGTITIEDVGEFRVTMDRIGTVAPHPAAAGRCLCGGPWPCPDIDAPNYRPEAYARHGAAPPSEDAVPLDVDWYAEAMRWKAIAEDNIAKAPSDAAARCPDCGAKPGKPHGQAEYGRCDGYPRRASHPGDAGLAEVAGIDGCIAIVQQTLDTVRGEDDGESRTIRASIAAREHVIALLTAYRGRAIAALTPTADPA